MDCMAFGSWEQCRVTLLLKIHLRINFLSPVDADISRLSVDIKNHNRLLAMSLNYVVAVTWNLGFQDMRLIGRCICTDHSRPNI
jgi:hypothetical protein